MSASHEGISVCPLKRETRFFLVEHANGLLKDYSLEASASALASGSAHDEDTSSKAIAVIAFFILQLCLNDYRWIDAGLFVFLVVVINRLKFASTVFCPRSSDASFVRKVCVALNLLLYRLLHSKKSSLQR